MIGTKKSLGISEILSPVLPSPFHIEMKKSSRGAVAVISGVMSISEYTAEIIELTAHSGRVWIVGESLSISVLEGRVIEIYGKITEVKFGYGKA